MSEDFQWREVSRSNPDSIVGVSSNHDSEVQNFESFLHVSSSDGSNQSGMYNGKNAVIRSDISGLRLNKEIHSAVNSVRSNIPTAVISNGSVRSDIPMANGNPFLSTTTPSVLESQVPSNSSTQPQNDQWVKIYSSIPKREAPLYNTLIVSGDISNPKSVQVEHTPDGRSSHNASLNVPKKSKKKNKKTKKVRSIRFKDSMGNKYLDTIMEVEDSGSDNEEGEVNTAFFVHSQISGGGNINDNNSAQGPATGIRYRNDVSLKKQEYDDLSLGSTGTFDTLQSRSSDSMSLSSSATHQWSRNQVEGYVESLSLKSLRTLDWGASTLKQKKTHGVFPLLQIRLEGVPHTRIAQVFTRLYR